MSTLQTTNLKNPSSGSNNIVLATDGSTTITTLNGTTITGTSVRGVITSGTAVASTSGTAIDFTSIPSWVKRVTVMFNGVSTNGASNYLVQIGTGGSPTTTGYNALCTRAWSANQVNSYTSTAGFIYGSDQAGFAWYGHIVLTNISGNTWVASGLIGTTLSTTMTIQGTGSLALGGVLERVRITTVNGTDAFDAGSINILYEG